MKRPASFVPQGISVVVPAWNEEQRLPRTLDQYLPLLEAFGLPFEVLVVLDGVTDRTAEVAKAYESRGVRTLEFPERLGKGGAVLVGFRLAQYNVLGFLDADAPITAVSAAYLISELSDSDCTIACRWHPASNRDRGKPLSRLLLSKTWNLSVRAILGLRVRDAQCGAKFFRREVVMAVLPRVTLTNWAFDACLLFHIQRAGFEVKEVPVNWSDDPGTKLNVDRVAPLMFISLVGVRLMSMPKLANISRRLAGRVYAHLS